jgi:hypothetical protein
MEGTAMIFQYKAYNLLSLKDETMQILFCEAEGSLPW